MNENLEEKKESEEDDKPGFRINLPFGMGWLRGDGSHLAALLPTIRWLIVFSTILYLILSAIEAAK